MFVQKRPRHQTTRPITIPGDVCVRNMPSIRPHVRIQSDEGLYQDNLENNNETSILKQKRNTNDEERLRRVDPRIGLES